MSASTLERVPSGPESTWQEVAASNRERIATLERESERHRESIHALRSEAQAVRYLAEKVADLAGDVKDIADRVEVIARDAVHRPSASGMTVFGQYIGLIVAVTALVIAATR